MLVEHEYARGGSLAYIAAWDVHHARLFGRLEAISGSGPNSPARPRQLAQSNRNLLLRHAMAES
jgi:hypothetical protein